MRRILFFVVLLFGLLLLPQAVPADQVSLGWNASTSTEVTGYGIDYGTVSGSYAYTQDAGNALSCIVTGLSQGSTYYFAAYAYDSSGNRSVHSNEVSYTVPSSCSYSISPKSVSIPASGASGGVSVTTQSSCAWTAGSAASWMSITGGGAGSGTANYSASANTGTSQRTSASTIAGQTFTVTQAGAIPPPATTYTITSSGSSSAGTIAPSGIVTVKAGGSQTFSIRPVLGHYIVSVVVDGRSVGRLSSYTFRNVTANHTIVVSFR